MDEGGAGEEVGEVQGEGEAGGVGFGHQVAHFIVDGDGEAGADAVLADEVVHLHDEEVEEVHCGTLHHPVHPAWYVL